MNIAIIGKSFPRLTQYLEEHGHTYTVFRDTLLKHKELPNTHIVDFRTMPETKARIESFGPFDAVVTIYEQYITNAADIAEHLGLPGLTQEAALACTNKAIMREKFAQAPKKISPDYQVVTSFEDIEKFMENHSFPVILKPANLAKSLLVSKNSDMNELRSNFEKMLQRIEKVYEKYAPRNERIVLIEEFMQGSIHSIDAFVGDSIDDVHLMADPVDYETGYDIGYDDNFHYSRIIPSALPTEMVVDFKEVATLGVQALGMTNSAAHIEIIVTEEGPRIVEIGARNGGYRERMHLLANSIDIYGAFLDTVLGKTPDITPKKHDCCAVLELFPKQAGSFDSINNLEKLKQLDSFYSVSVKYKPGTECGKSSDGFKAAAVVVLHNENQHAFNDDLDFIKKHVEVVTR